MTLFEISIRYHDQAEVLSQRMGELRGQLPELEESRREAVERRLRVLAAMWRETRELAILCERYYDRGYWRDGKYTV